MSDVSTIIIDDRSVRVIPLAIWERLPWIVRHAGWTGESPRHITADELYNVLDHGEPGEYILLPERNSEDQ